MSNGTTILDPKLLAQLDRLALVSRRLRAGQLQGERRSPKRGSSVEFADFRTYTPGDDFRQIDWNAYARLERLFLKLFVAEEDLTIHLLLDASSSMAWGEPDKWGYSQRLAAALGYVALVGLDRLTGAALNHGVTRFRPHRSKQQALAWFNWLATLKTGGELDPRAALHKYMARARHPGPLLLISDLLGDGWQRGLRELAGRNFEITLLHVLAPQEISPTLEGDLRLVDCENATSVEITADYDLLKRYREHFQAWQGQIKETCATIGASYIPVETTLPIEDLVLAYLRRYDVIR